MGSARKNALLPLDPLAMIGHGVEAEASGNADQERSSSGYAFDRREPDGCFAEIGRGRATGSEKGEGIGESQSAVGEAEGWLKTVGTLMES
jgi:hypothetical protein